jgi:iron complex transport system substrate-binding protein
VVPFAHILILQKGLVDGGKAWIMMVPWSKTNMRRRFWLLAVCIALCLTGCGGQMEQEKTQTNVQTESASESVASEEQAGVDGGTPQEQNVQSDTLAAPQHIELSYAQEFTLDSYENGCTLITISDGSLFLVVPEELSGLSDEELLLQAGLADIKASGTGQTDGKL